ncbi:MAG: M13 family metallopeptidase [Butyrivibrio sp.]|nr:M13 family metallopeptidase [Butyrivibrio sp.]
MKKKLVAILLTVAMLSTFIGCGKANTAPTEPAAQEEAESVAETAESSAETTTEAETTETAESAEVSEESEGAVTTGGIPWIDSDIKENVSADTEVNLKDDFHLYANKDWILENEIPAGYSSWSHYAECGLEVKQKCMELLEDESIDGHDAEVVHTLNKLILDWDTRNAAGVSEIQGNFDKILEAKSTDDITELLTGKDTLYEYFDFVGYGADTGLNDPETYLVCVGSPSLLLEDSAEYTERTEYGDMLYGYRKDQFAYIAAKYGLSDADIEKYFNAAIDLETILAKKIPTTMEQYSEDFYDKINNEMPFEETVALSKVFPLEKLLTNTGYKYGGKYLVTTPDYFEALDEAYTEEHLDGIKGLMLIRYAMGYAGVTDKDTYDTCNELANSYFGTSGTVSDEEMAYNKVVSLVPASMQKVYIAKYGSAEDKKRMEDLCQEVIDTYREMLSENTWASEEVKNYAIEKLDKMVIHAAYPDKFRDTSKIDVSDCTLIEAVDRISRDELNYNLSLIGKKLDKEMWAEGFNILECNAFYSPTENTINMIIGMMGEPFYSSDMSIEELYASIGAFWVGHEVSHAFDSNGSQFDAEGVYRDWWTEADREEFDKRVKKMDDYLDTIVAFGDQHFIGANIDTEMVADMTGLQCALRMASKVENFDYDKFFTKYAQMNASLEVYSSELQVLKQDSHPLNYSRSNVPIQQFEEFYETYDIKEGDGMYLAPEDRLIIW